MATLHSVVRSGVLEKVDVDVSGRDVVCRSIFLLASAKPWFVDDLANVTPFFWQQNGGTAGVRDLSAKEQVYDLWHGFITGEEIRTYEKLHIMRPGDRGVWELKTLDVRMFGWFYRPNTFIISRGIDAFSCKQHDLYAGLRDEAVRKRDELDLDLPKFVSGEYDDVLPT
jgi:hypothetical protein